MTIGIQLPHYAIAFVFSGLAAFLYLIHGAHSVLTPLHSSATFETSDHPIPPKPLENSPSL
jgi:hypothetical protein